MKGFSNNRKLQCVWTKNYQQETCILAWSIPTYPVTCAMLLKVPTTITAISNLAKQHLGKINVALEHQHFCQSYQQIIDAKGWGDFLEIVPCEDECLHIMF
ncbi:uncharacterized protein LOC127867152 [Dreissena polymorpha]|uniref:uncharacterized protein LOC127867152 n=1 Tax=Dreissena polymorpha TaxID=45954 RepID=UPI002264DF37|nr:uncharacterized protein LOC127867152 [Dreissena polymorpha]